MLMLGFFFFFLGFFLKDKRFLGRFVGQRCNLGEHIFMGFDLLFLYSNSINAPEYSKSIVVLVYTYCRFFLVFYQLRYFYIGFLRIYDR